MALRNRKYAPKDYLALVISLVLAFSVWFIHNMSLSYSDLVHRPVVPVCDIDAHDNVSSNSGVIAARCKLSGFGILFLKSSAKKPAVQVKIASEDMHPYKGDDMYFMSSSDFTKYFHDIFSDEAQLEYFVTDTVFFHFSRMNNKKVPVRVFSSLDFVPQYMASGELKIIPDSVLVYGQEEELSSIEYVNTEPIRLSGLSSDAYGVVDLRVPDGVRLSTERVDYSISVIRYVEQDFEVPVKVIGAPMNQNVRVMPSTATVRVRFSSFDDSFEECFVRIGYDEFENSISGHCVGTVVNLPPSVIDWRVVPDVFNCYVIGQE